MKKHLTIIIFLILFSATVLAEEKIIGNSVINEDTNSKLSATPHTAFCIFGSECVQEFDSLNKNSFDKGNMRLFWRYDLPLESFRIEEWKPAKYLEVSRNISCDGNLNVLKNVNEGKNKDVGICTKQVDNNSGGFIEQTQWVSNIKNSNKNQGTASLDVNVLISHARWQTYFGEIEHVLTKNSHYYVFKDTINIKKKENKKFRAIYKPHASERIGKFDYGWFNGSNYCFSDDSCDYIFIDDPWFNLAWGKNKQQTITANSDINVGAILKFNFDSSAIISAGDMQADCDDIRVVYQDVTALDYNVSGCNTTDTNVFYRSQALLLNTQVDSTNYKMYFDNSAAPNLDATHANVVCEEIDANGLCWQISDDFSVDTIVEDNWRKLNATGVTQIAAGVLDLNGTSTGVANTKKISWNYGFQALAEVCRETGAEGPQLTLQSETDTSFVVWDSRFQDPAIVRFNTPTAGVDTANRGVNTCETFDTWSMNIKGQDANILFKIPPDNNFLLILEDTNQNLDKISGLYNDMNINLVGPGSINTGLSFDSFKLRTFVQTEPTITLGADVILLLHKILQIDGDADTTTNQWFSTHVDGNLTLNFDVNADESFTGDLNYSTSALQGTGTKIYDDANILQSRFTCGSTSFPMTNNNCNVDINISTISDGNYFFLSDFSTSNTNDFNSTDVNIAIDNTLPVFVSQEITSGQTSSAPDFNITFSDSNLRRCWWNGILNDVLDSSNNVVDANDSGGCNIIDPKILSEDDAFKLEVFGSDQADNNSLLLTTSTYTFNAQGGEPAAGGGGGGGGGGASETSSIFELVSANEDNEYGLIVRKYIDNSFDLIIENVSSQEINSIFFNFHDLEDRIELQTPIESFVIPRADRKRFTFVFDAKELPEDLNQTITKLTITTNQKTKEFDLITKYESDFITEMIKIGRIPLFGITTNFILFLVSIILLGLTIGFPQIPTKQLSGIGRVIFVIISFVTGIGLVFTGI